MAEHIHSFEGGMDKDTSSFKYPKNKYFEARNMRLTVGKNNQQFSMKTIHGNELYFTTEGYTYKGHCFIRENLVLFLESFDTTTGDIIFELDPSNPPLTGTVLNLSNPVFTGYLTFSDDKLSTAASYESSDIRKIYFSDETNNVRMVDLDKDYSGFEADDLNILPPTNHVGIEYTAIEEGGQINSGMVQYTYKLYNKYGAETYFAPASTILPITQGPIHSVTNYRTRFKGGVKEEPCDKSIRFEISNDIDTSKFDYIQVIGIYYEDLDISPSIKVLGDYPFIENTIEFLDIGSGYSDEYTVAEFTALINVFSAGSLENKFNYLFAADITESIFDSDFDARAYRFANSGTYANIAKVVETDGSYYAILRAGVTRPGVGGTAALGDWVYYDSSGVYQSSHANYDEVGYGTDFGVPEDADLICPDNYLSEDFTAASYVQGDHFYYDEDNTSTYGYVGGSGLNVSYKITAVDIHEEAWHATSGIDSQSVSSGSDGFKRMYQYSSGAMSIASEDYMLGTLDNYASPLRASLNRSSQRDEIYRYSLILLDKYGRSSYAKWIGDIRMPKTFDTYDDGSDNALTYNLTDLGGTGTSYTVKRLNVEFTVSNISDPNVVGFQITCVERTASNSTIVDSGWMGSLELVVSITPLTYNIDGMVFPSSLAIGNLGTIATTLAGYATFKTVTSALSDVYKEYISPDINFNSTNVSTAPTKFYSYGSSECAASTYRYGTDSGTVATVDKTAHFKQYGVYGKTTYSSSLYAELDIYDFGIFSDSTYTAGNSTSAFSESLHTTTVYNYCKGGNSDGTVPYGYVSYNAGARGTCGIVYGEEGSHYATTNSPFVSASGLEAIYVSRKNVIEPYGGLSYQARSISEYSPVSPYVVVSGGAGSVDISGDTYIGIFEHIRTMVSDNPDLNDGDTNVEILYLPVESKYNVVARSGEPFYKLPTSNVAVNAILGIKEDPGAWTYDQTGDALYLQDFYLYDYNNTYNRVSNVKSFNPPPVGYVVGEVQRYDTKVIASEEKSNRELIDSWTKFLFANELELKTEYGPVTDITLVGDNLISIQEKAIASLSVNEREQMQGDTGTALIFGSGGILERYDYINVSIGCQSKYGFTNSPTGLYLYDGNNKGIYALTTKGEPSLSRQLYMDSYFKEQEYSGFDVIDAGYNRKFNEVVFTFDIDGTTQESLVLNDTKGIFSHIKDTDRHNYLFDDSSFMTINSSNTSSNFYLGNVEASQQIDGHNIECSLTVISRPEHPNLSRFDNLQWNSIVANNTSGIEQATITFDTVQSINTYQDTGVLAKDNFRRKMRMWRLNFLRDSISIRSTLSPRLRSEWLKTTFKFTPNNSKILIDSIKAIFQPNKI